MKYALIRKNERDYYPSVVFASAPREVLKGDRDSSVNFYLVFDESGKKLVWREELDWDNFSTQLEGVNYWLQKKMFIDAYAEKVPEEPSWEVSLSEFLNGLDFLWKYLMNEPHQTIEELSNAIDKMPEELFTKCKEIAEKYPYPEYIKLPSKNENLTVATLNFSKAVIRSVEAEKDTVKVLLTGMYDCDMELIFRGNAFASKSALAKDQKPWRNGRFLVDNGVTYLVNNISYWSAEQFAKTAKFFRGDECFVKIIPFQR